MLPQTHSFPSIPSSLTQQTIYSNQVTYFFCIRRQNRQHSFKGRVWAPQPTAFIQGHSVSSISGQSILKVWTGTWFKPWYWKGLRLAIKTRLDPRVLLPPWINLPSTTIKDGEDLYFLASFSVVLERHKQEAATSGTWPQRNKGQKYNEPFRNQKPQLTSAEE